MQLRLFFLLLGYFTTIFSHKIFPVPDKFEIGLIWNLLVFNPFQLLGGTICFIIGFLSFSRVMKELIIMKRKDNNFYGKEWKWIFFLCILFILIANKSMILAFFSLGFSLYYGITDANENNKVVQNN